MICRRTYGAEMKQNADCYDIMEESGDEASCTSSTASVDHHAKLRERSQRARNVSEKKRRDKLNMYITQLASLLPPEGHQKKDKSSVLKHSVEYLKHKNESIHGSDNGKCATTKCFFSAEDLGILMKELISGFIITINETGKIIYIADFVNELLGIDHESLLGESIESLMHPNDVERVLQELTKTTPINEIENINIGDRHRVGLRRSIDYIQFAFRCNVARGENVMADNLLCCDGFWSQEYCHEESDCPLDLLVRPLVNARVANKSSSMMDKTASFSTQLGMDGKFLLIDASCSLVIGYLPYELLDTSMYFYIHEHDLADVVELHRKLMKSPESCSVMSFFRFRCKSEEWLLLKTILKVTFNPMTEKCEYIQAYFALATQAEIVQNNKLKISPHDDPVIGSSMERRGSYEEMMKTSVLEPETRMSKGSAKLHNISQVNDVSNAAITIQSRRPSEDSFSEQGSLIPKNDSRYPAKCAKAKGEAVDGPKDVEEALQSQLKMKLKMLSQSISTQKHKLNAMLEIMRNLQREMEVMQSTQTQQNYQNQIAEHLKKSIEEQEKQCHKLRIILDGKIKAAETKKLAMQLREKSKMVKSTVENIEKTRFRSSHEDFRRANREQINSAPTLSSDVQTSPRTFSTPNSPLKSPCSYRENQFLKRTLPIAERSRDAKVSCNLEKSKQLPQITDKNPPPAPQMKDSEDLSLQRQLQQLQHQQEVLNARGMALATQRNIPHDRVELLQLLLRQQKGTSPQEQQQSASSRPDNSTATVSSMFQISRDRFSSDGEVDFSQLQQQQQGSYLPADKQKLIEALGSIVNNFLQQIADNNLTFQQCAEGGVCKPDSPVSHELYFQLAPLQMQLQAQMQLLGSQQQSEDEQKQSIAQVLQCLQQLQQIQISLLQRNLNARDANESSEQLQHIDVNAQLDERSGGYLQSPSPRESSLRFQGPLSDSESCSSFVSVNFAKDNSQRKFGIEQGKPSQFRVPPSPTGSYTYGQYGVPISPRQQSVIPSSNDYTRSSGSISMDQAGHHSFGPYAPSTSPSLSGGNYRHGSGSDSNYMDMTTRSSFSNDNDVGFRNLLRPGSESQDDHSEAEKKEKKLHDDVLYDYMDNLPGQAQQLMQLHQAQRVHIIRMQHQQLETLQQNSCRQVEQQHQQQQQQLEQQHQFKQQQQQLEQQQQQLEQHQLQQHHHGQPLQQQHEHQQRSFSSITGESDQGLRTNCELGSTHSLHQPENINRGSPDGSKIQSSGSQDNWQNDLQADQVVSMSDFDLLELLNGQTSWSFDEDDEKVLDLLIAEGGDTFSI